MTMQSPPRWVQLSFDQVLSVHEATQALRDGARRAYARTDLPYARELDRLADELQALIVHVNTRGRSL